MINSFALTLSLSGLVAATVGALWILFPVQKVAAFFRFGNVRSWRGFPKFTGAHAARLLFVGGLAAIGLGTVSFFIPLLNNTPAGASALLLLTAFFMGVGLRRKRLCRSFFRGQDYKQL